MTDDARPVSPLAALILGVIAQEEANGNQLNYSDIARRGGPDLSRNNVHRYASRRLDQLIPIEKRRALALGLRVHPIVVDRAVAESLDLLLDPPADDWRTDPDLLDEDRRVIAGFIDYRKSQRKNAARRPNRGQYG